MTIEQCAFLVGGVGMRLGALTRFTPKPLLAVAGRPFLEHLLVKAAHHGLRKIVLLAGHQASAVEDWLESSDIAAHLGIRVEISIEPVPLGTGGALVHANGRLEDRFLLVNGDTWFDFDWRLLETCGRTAATMALTAVDDAERYETVTLTAEGLVSHISPRSGQSFPGLINGGVYCLSKTSLPTLPGPLSLEKDIIPALAARCELSGCRFDAPFMDIGVPESLACAEALLTPPSF